jgi:membrane protein required for colicin V production
MPGPFTPLDLGLGLIALISGLLAMYRGLTREVLSLLSWALAGAAAAFFVLYQQGLAQTLADKFFGGNVQLAKGGGAVLVFLFVLILVHLFTARLSDRVLDSHIGIIDRILGFGFGAARGFLLVLIGFVFYTNFSNTPPIGDKPYAWGIKDSQSLPLLVDAGKPFSEVMRGVGEYVTTKIGKKGALGGTETTPAAPADDGQGTNG